MAQPYVSTPSGRHDASQHPGFLTVDSNAPCVRDFVVRHVLKGTIRVIPAGRGKIAIIPTGAWYPDELLPASLRQEASENPNAGRIDGV